MDRFPYITDYCNELFAKEKMQWDYKFLRPVIVFSYFFIRCIVFPVNFILHRIPYGFEAYLIDRTMAFGMKYLARHEAAELLIRHVQLEPLLYRHLLACHPDHPGYEAGRKFNGIEGDYGIEKLTDVYWNNLTIGHDELSYEIVDRFDKDVFLENLSHIRTCRPDDVNALSRGGVAGEQTVFVSAVGGDESGAADCHDDYGVRRPENCRECMNSFGSDSIVLWCLRRIYINDREVLVDLDFFMQTGSNRGHYNSSAFFSNPSEYLYYHIVFDEVVYHLLRNRPAAEVPTESTGVLA